MARHSEHGRLFPVDLTPFQWQKFQAAGYSTPATGIIYRVPGTFWFQSDYRPRPLSGVPLGGIDTGGLYLEGAGTYGYSSIFNHYSPPGGPINVPFLGIAAGGQVWVLTTGQTKNYANQNRPTMGAPLTMYWGGGSGVLQADSIDYWGHYPVADMQFKSGAPVNVSLRAWAPFIPGDSKASNTPGAVFEIHLQNPTSIRQAGTLAFNFPGFADHRTRDEIIGWTSLAAAPVLPRPQVERHAPPEGLAGTWVEDRGWGMSYVLAALEKENVRAGGGLGTDGAKWHEIEKGLPAISHDTDDGGSSLAVDFSLEPDGEKIIQVILAWYAPEWEGNGNPGTGGRAILQQGIGYFSTGQRFTHMYASRFADAGEVAGFLARNHESLLNRIIGWQSVLYDEKQLPGWLGDVLLNAFYYFAPCSVWAQAKPPVGSWCKPEDGVFALNEAPRSCPTMSTFVNHAMAGPVLSMFFPDLALSNLRAFRASQREDGDITQMLGHWMDVATPGLYGSGAVSMGAYYVMQIYWLWKSTGDEQYLKEFYASAKRKLEQNCSIRPDLGLSQIIAMPSYGGGDIFEDTKMYGYMTHSGGWRLAAVEMMIEWAEKMGDTIYAEQLKEMLAAGKEAMQEYLWRGDHYLVYNDTTTGKVYDAFFSPQLNGQYNAHISGVPGVFPEANVEKVLETLRDKVCKISKWGIPPTYANPDGTIWTGPTNNYLTGKFLFCNHQVIWNAVLFMYEGQQNFGLELLRKHMELGYCQWGYMWDGVDCGGATGDDGEMSYGWDYWFNWSVWMAAAALAGGDFSILLKPGGLVYKMIEAGKMMEG